MMIIWYVFYRNKSNVLSYEHYFSLSGSSIGNGLKVYESSEVILVKNFEKDSLNSIYRYCKEYYMKNRFEMKKNISGIYFIYSTDNFEQNPNYQDWEYMEENDLIISYFFNTKSTDSFPVCSTTIGEKFKD